MATDALIAMEKAMTRDNILVNDRQLACARINSQEGQVFLFFFFFIFYFFLIFFFIFF